MFRKLSLLAFFLLVCFSYSTVFAQQIISLTWDDVVGISQKENLELKIGQQEYRHQRLNKWKALSDFLPSVTYQFQGQNNIELPEFVFMGQRIRVGTDYNFSHALQLRYPIFTGGLRLANWKIQHSLQKSLAEQLRNKEEEVVLKALEAYFNAILSDALIEVNRQAHQAAKANFEQVEKFYEVGAASQLDYLRAKSRFTSTISPLTSARNARKLALENLKFILNINPSDSLIILDSLLRMDFLGDWGEADLKDLQEIALNERPDLRSADYQEKAVGAQKIIAGSRFFPTVNFIASVQHQAQINTMDVTREDYNRVKMAMISVQLPLFEGGRRALDYQQARINHKKAQIQIEQLRRAILLEVESGYRQFREAQSNLISLEQATREAREALRLANLSYKEGLSTQVDVLNAQLSYTSSEAQFKQGIYKYNVSQLQLLKSIGKLHTIWNEEKN